MRTLCLIVALGASLCFAQTADDVKKETSEAVDATKRYATEKKDEFVARIDTKLKTLKDDVTRLKDKTKDGADATVKDLETKQKKTDEKFAEVKKTGDKAWSSLKSGVEGAVNELEKGVEGAKSK